MGAIHSACVALPPAPRPGPVSVIRCMGGVPLVCMAVVSDCHLKGVVGVIIVTWGRMFVDPSLSRGVPKNLFCSVPRSRRHERPRSSRLQHSTSFRARNPNKASMTSMLAAASIKVMDALFGLVARNDAECRKRELLGRSWRRDWAMRNLQLFFTDR